MIATCRDSIAALDDYLDQRLPSVQRALIDFHLQGCVHCTEYFRTYRDTVRLSNALGAGELGARRPAPGIDSLVEAIIGKLTRPS
jgi:anti-sigma factor RsiW